MPSERIQHDLISHNPLLHLVHLGLSPDEVKASIIDELAPFFLSVTSLEALATLLAAEYVNVLSIKMKPRLDSILRHDLYNFIRFAAEAKPKEFLDVVSMHHPMITQRLKRYWNLYHSQRYLSSLEDGDFAYEVFQSIGVVIEGMMFPYISLLYDLVTLLNGSDYIHNMKRKPSLGQQMRVVHESGYIRDLLAPPPHKIILSDWRNVANHHSYETDGNTTTIYPTGSNQVSFIMTRADLLGLVIEVSSIFRVMGTAYRLTIADQIDLVGVVVHAETDPDYSRYVELSSSLLTQGFMLQDASFSGDQSRIALEDLRPEDRMTRIIHASQLVYSLWTMTASKMNEVVYQVEGQPLFLARASSDTCARVASEGWSVLADEAEWRELPSGRLLSRGGTTKDQP